MVRFVFLIFNASLATQYSVLASASIEYMGFIQSYSLRDYTYPVGHEWFFSSIWI